MDDLTHYMEATARLKQELAELREAVAMVVKEAHMDKWAREKLAFILWRERSGE